MGKVNLLELLRLFDDYILIKKDDRFPEYNPGSDLDLIVFDREVAIRAICDNYKTRIADAGELKVSQSDAYCHIDFVFNAELDLRIDLINNFDFFEKFEVKPNFIVKLFKDRKCIPCGEGHVYVPSDEDELTLRYFEYLEWFDRRPDKIKHIDYICEIEDTLNKQRFFENTHRYIQFKPKSWHSYNPPNPYSGREAISLIKLGIRSLLAAVFRRLGLKIGSPLE